MEHVKLRFGKKLTAAIADLLRRESLSEAAWLAALRISVSIADPILAEAIEASWANDADQLNHILKLIGPTELLSDRALFARLERGDHTAIPALEDKLRGKNDAYWWQAGRYLWSDRLDRRFRRDRLARRFLFGRRQ